MINDNIRQEKEQINLKRNLDILDNADNEQFIKMVKPKQTTEIKEQ